MRNKRISVIGSGQIDSRQYSQAWDLGLGLARAGFDIVCGGLGGTMEAVCKGALQGQGQTIGILPGEDLQNANPYICWPIATGLGPMRNYLVVLNGSLVIAFAGGPGTFSEIGLALKIGKPVIALGQWPQFTEVISAEDVPQTLQLCKTLLQCA